MSSPIVAPPPGIAVVGCGYWGNNLVRNFAELNALVAVSDREPDVVAALSAQFHVLQMSIDELLSDDRIVGVAVAAPAAQHFELARQALEADKHVFVEKPLSLEVGEAEELCELAANRHRILMVGHLLQYHPAFLKLKGLVNEGTLGRVQYLYSNRLNLGRIRREEDILWSFAPHDISMILGLVRTEPNAVTAVGGAYLHQSIADVTTTHLAFPGGERAHVFVSWLHPFKEQKLVVVGDRGMAVFDDGQPWESKLTLYQHRIDWRDGMPQPFRAQPQCVAISPAEPLELECRHFLDCIVTGEVPRTDGQEGVRVLRVLKAASDAMHPSMTVSKERAGNQPEYFLHESSYVDPGCAIGAGTKIWHFSHILTRTTIGRNCTVGQNVMVGPDVMIGDNCKLQNNVSVYPGVTLEDGVFCGPSCVFTNVLNPRATIERKDEFRATRVGRGATIGANATIVCGHDIGEYAFVAAGAVVTSDVAKHALMAGVPAKRIGWMSHDGERLGDDLVCPRSGKRYAEVSNEELVEVRE